MSIIYEALQKLDEGNNPQAVPNQQQQGAVEPNQKILNKKAIPIIVLILIALVVILPLIFGRQYIAEKISSLLFLVKKGPLSDSQFKPPLFLSSSNSEAEKTTETYSLGGIIYDLEVPVVIVNGKSLKEGDLIDDYKVVEITKSSTLLVSIEDESQLTLFMDF